METLAALFVALVLIVGVVAGSVYLGTSLADKPAPVTDTPFCGGSSPSTPQPANGR